MLFRINCLAFVLWFSSTLLGQPTTLKELEAQFPSQEFQESIDFWVSVFTEHDENAVIFHDREDVRLVYHVERFAKGIEGDAAQKRLQQRRLKQVLGEVEAALRGLSKGGHPRNALQTAIARRFQELGEEPTSKQLHQFSQRVRMQRGVRSKFALGLGRSGRYLEYIEAIFRDRGLPIELALLPHVESSFYYGARSNVGAAGIWQLMRGTSRSLLTINSRLDERLDPIAASEAAANILQENYAALESWPLAITAYNHGLNGMRRAREKHGGDLATIIKEYRSRLFGFASKNFYAEFLAAVFVVRNREHFFPGVQDEPVLEFDRVRLAQSFRASDLSTLPELDLEQLKELNPQLMPAVWSSGVLPASVELRVPKGMGGAVQSGLEQLQPVQASAGGPVDLPGNSGYRVRRGDTLELIARRFGVTESALQATNGIANKHRIYAGQLLRLPEDARATADSVGPTHYTVRKGDSLAKIASRFGTSVGQLEVLNSIPDRHQIQVGQQLTIQGTTHYRVQRGDTLVKIAAQFQTSVAVLKSANNIRNSDRIYQGQMLQIPTGQ